MAAGKLGLIINPIAGMGGKVALKGTDGAFVLDIAIKRGAKPESGKKAERALRMLAGIRDDFLIITCQGAMGADLCEKLGLPYRSVYRCTENTQPADTVKAAKLIAAEGVDLLLFAGGDGTARNIYEAVGDQFPVLGIPAGVKIQSAVFALTPEAAGSVAALAARKQVLKLENREVVDLDEDAYRTGHVSATLYGTMLVPDQPAFMQNMKQSGFTSDRDQMHGIAEYLVEHMEQDVYYAIGSGSTAKCVPDYLGLSYELLGVDIIRNRQVAASDVTEEELWKYAQSGKLKIIVSPIGGQGFIFGRGNHQFSARVLSAVGRGNITIVSPVSKLLSITGGKLRVDCGDALVNEELHGYYNVVSGYGYFLSFLCG